MTAHTAHVCAGASIGRACDGVTRSQDCDTPLQLGVCHCKPDPENSCKYAHDGECDESKRPHMSLVAGRLRHPPVAHAG
jgi:hypothetical protein